MVGAGGAGRALAFGAKHRGAHVIIFNRNFGNNLQLYVQFISIRRFTSFSYFCHCLEERAKALAQAVSGEALPYECLEKFCPKNGMILANASAIGMQPNTNQTPVSKVLSACVCVFVL